MNVPDPSGGKPPSDTVAILDLTDLEGRAHRLWLRSVGEPGLEPRFLLLVLDGNRGFPLALEAAENEALVNEAGNAPGLIAGLGYPDPEHATIVRRRYRDLTSRAPAHRIPLLDPTVHYETGGADAFLEFVRAFVLPAVAERFPLAPLTLFGHSLSGFFALRSLLSHGLPVVNVVVADPSVWWNDHQLIDEARAGAFGRSAAGKGEAIRVAILIAGKRAGRPDVPDAQGTRIRALRAGPDGADLGRLLQHDPRLEVSIHEMADESHGSIMKPGIDLALRIASDL